MRKKIIATILVFVMIFPVCFTTINLAYEEVKTNQKTTSEEENNQNELEKTKKEETDTNKTNQTDKVETNKTDVKDEEDKTDIIDTDPIDKTNTIEQTDVDSNKPTTIEKETAVEKKETKTEDTKSKEIKKDESTNEDKQEEEKETDDDIMSYALTNETSSRLEDGTYRIKSKINQNKVFQVEGNATTNGKRIKLANNLSVSMSQNVIVKYLNDGYYSLTFENSKKVLDVPGASKKQGTTLQQYNSNNSEAQQWILKADGNGYYSIISRCNGLYVDVPAGKAVTGANLQLYKGNNTDAQKFKFEKVEPVKSEKTIE